MDIKKSKMAEHLKYEIKNLNPHSDSRGWLVEMIKQDEIAENIRQVYIATIEPGSVRGNHYHKERVEWFFIVSGEAEICLEDIKTKERKVIEVSAANPQRITVFSGIAHAIENKGNQTVYLASAQNNVFDPQNPDTYDYRIVDF